jgi:lysine 6-dehydrogenase
MKITVLGAGAIGSSIACDLVLRKEVTHVQVVDHKAAALGRITDEIDSGKLRTARVDVRDERRLAAVLAGSACVVSSVDPQLHARLARVALSVGAHFCDLGGSEKALESELALGEEAAARSRWIVPNCGFAPGFVNVLVMKGIEEFESVEDVVIRGGSLPMEAEPPFFHRIAYAAEKLIDDYTSPATMVRDGEVVDVEPLTGLEQLSFSPPFVRLEAFYTSGKLSTLPHDLAGRIRTLDYKTLRHPGHAAAIRSVFALGFGEDRFVDVRTHLTYRDILARKLRQQLGGAYDDAVVLRVSITGHREGRRQVLIYELMELHRDEATAMQRCTGYPTAVVATLLGGGHVPGGGAAPPEHIIPRDRFFEALAERGMRVETRWEEPSEHHHEMGESEAAHLTPWSD